MATWASARSAERSWSPRASTVCGRKCHAASRPTAPSTSTATSTAGERVLIFKHTALHCALGMCRCQTLMRVRSTLLCRGALRGGENSVAEILPPKPTKIGGNGTWVQSSVGMQHVCGVKANGNAYCFGEGWHGQLGTGKRNKCPSSKPCKVNFDLKWKEVSVGEYSTCGVAENGCAYCWGEDVDGRLGNGKPNAFYLLPTLVSASCQWGSGNSAAR